MNIRLVLGVLLLPILASCGSRGGPSLADEGLRVVRPLILAADQVVVHAVSGNVADENPPLSENRLVLTESQRLEIDQLILDRDSFKGVTILDCDPVGEKLKEVVQGLLDDLS